MAPGTMTPNIPDAWMRVLEELSARDDLSKTALPRDALRMYRLIEARIEKGDGPFFENEETRKQAEVMML